MQRVLDVFVAPEFGLHVRVAEDSLFWVELFAVRAQEAAVEGNGGEEGELRRGLAGFEGVGEWRGEEAEGRAHGASGF